MKFFKDTGINFISQWLLIILSLAISAIIGRRFGPEGKGVYALMVMFNSLILLASNVGLSRASIFFVGRDKYSINQAAGNLLTLSIPIGLVTTAITFGALNLYNRPIFGEIPLSYALILSFLAPILFAKLAVLDLFAAIQEFFWSNSVNLIDFAVRLALILLILVVGASFDVLVWAMVTSLAVSTIISWIVLRRKIGNIPIGIDRNLVTDFTKYGIKAYSYSVTNFLNLRVDQFLIGFFLNVGQVGIYSVSVSISELAMKLAKAVTISLFPKISKSDVESANRYTGVVIRLTIMLTILLAGFLVVFGRLIILWLFGDEFLSAFVPLLILLPGAILFSILQILTTDLSGRGRPEIGTYTTIFGLVITIFGNWLLTPRMGINGAALVASVTYGITALITVVIFLRITSQAAQDIFVPSKEDARMMRNIWGRVYAMAQLR